MAKATHHEDAPTAQAMVEILNTAANAPAPEASPALEEETPKLQKPDGMPRALFEKLKAAHEEADALDRKTLIALLDELTQREAHPAEAAFADLVGLDDAEKV